MSYEWVLFWNLLLASSKVFDFMIATCGDMRFCDSKASHVLLFVSYPKPELNLNRIVFCCIGPTCTFVLFCIFYYI